MQKWLLALCLLFSYPVFAEEPVEAVDDEVDLLAPEEEPEVEEAVQEPVKLPTCDDENMIDQVKSAVIDYNKEHPAESMLDKRNRLLQIRSLDKYQTEFVTGFNSKNNRVVANKLLMTKINKGLSDNQIVLCKSDIESSRYSSIYVMMYIDKGETVKAYILNFLSNPEEDFVLDIR